MEILSSIERLCKGASLEVYPSELSERNIRRSGNATTTGWLPLEGIEPGRRGSASVTVVFTGHADARIAMYAQECAPSLPDLHDQPKLGLVWEARAA
jgi:hypothetical protein